MNNVLVVCGPTATGKTALAVHLAKQINGELISADSRQIYRGMDIGTGKDLPDNAKTVVSALKAVFHDTVYDLVSYDCAGIPLWMYDVVDPDEDFSVSHYRSLVLRVMENIWSRGKTPVVVGGTGFYISSLIAAPDSIDIPPNAELRKKLASQTVSDLQVQLNALSHNVYSSLNNSDKHNPRRLIRKIEITLERMEGGAASPDKLPEHSVYIAGLTASVPVLTRRIDERVSERVKQGILSEVTGLLDKGYTWSLPSMNSLGYIQWKPYTEETNMYKKNMLTADIIKQWKLDELAYAKRQITWFKKFAGIRWYDIIGAEFPFDVTRSILAWYTDAGHEHEN